MLLDVIFREHISVSCSILQDRHYFFVGTELFTDMSKKYRNLLSFGLEGFARKSKVFTVFENKRCKNTFWAINLYDKVVPHAL